MSKQVLVTSRSFGSIDSAPMDILEREGCAVTMMGADFDMERFAAAVRDSDVLIIGAHAFPPELMARCKKLKLICKHGAGLDNIPLDAAKDLGVAVCNAPGTNSNAVADLTFGPPGPGGAVEVLHRAGCLRKNPGPLGVRRGGPVRGPAGRRL